MTLFKHEISQHLKLTLIWTITMLGYIAMIVYIFPEMSDQMTQMATMMGSMGVFTSALNLDLKSMTSLFGFYAMEIENMVGIGGALFAAYLGMILLGKEEKQHTAEFLFSHPLKRGNIYRQKLGSLIFLLTLFNGLLVAGALTMIHLSNQKVDLPIFLQFHLAILLLHLVIGLICYSFAALSHKISTAVGIGIALMLYFLNIIINLWDKAEPFKYMTPYQFTYGSEIIKNNGLDWLLIASNFGIALICLLVGYLVFNFRDLAN